MSDLVSTIVVTVELAVAMMRRRNIWTDRDAVGMHLAGARLAQALQEFLVE